LGKRFSAEELATIVAEARARWHVPGMAVGLLQDGEPVFAADGVRDLDANDPVRPETPFRVASITKPFVGTLTQTLAQDGLLSLDEPPPGARTTASVRQLLSHQAGLAIEWPVDLDDADDDEALQRLAAREPERLTVGPGELFSYCNTGYWFAGAGIARASGSTFEEAMSDRVLGPLGLAATAFEPPAGVARGHEQVEPGSDEHYPVDDAYPRVRRPSGGLWSTVGDLVVFGAHQVGEAGPLTRESILEMQRPLIPVPGGSYGLGWFLLDRQGRSSVEHPGSAAGYQSLLLVVPETRLVFAALTNSSRGSTAIRDVLQVLGLGQTSPPPVELSADELDRFTGRYEGQGIRIAVSQSDGGLDLELAEFNPFTNESASYPPVRAHSVGDREFEVSSGEWEGDRFDFPREGFVRTYVLAQRVE
jgi:CubicO group peptidase (beta-lactamase class C family)